MTTVAEEAAQLVSGPRQEAYGDCTESARRIAHAFTGILGHTVHPYQVPLLMTGLKMVRASLNPGYRDSLVDGVGYLLNAEQIDGEIFECSASSPARSSTASPHWSET